jgi:hypothetical protein
MTRLRIARLRQRHGLTWEQACLMAALVWGASDD